MCVAALAWNAHPEWRLVVIGNRDEFHERPSAPLARWGADSPIIAGKDLRSGGTWLGVADTGRFVLVTNRRGFGEPLAGRVSRGRIVTDMLNASGEYGDPAQVRLDDFNPFNLLVVADNGLHFLANRPQPVRTRLVGGIYGLSNGDLDEPWPKTLALKEALLGWLGAEGAARQSLLEALASEARPAIGLAADAPSDIAFEARDTAPFIRNPVYGTRCSTVVTVDAKGHGTIAERRFDANGHSIGDTELAFRWPA